ncbi:hypothetical protein [Vibrio vulnificus]|uniref:hypothetical protein n=1 Tax=Vibrio vulnificus TaxID=672 RepID=UPI001593AE0D|nr:hypothetical protein [Vibrio vulnificus]EJE8558665.1 hypothetical protein [Vibrio vulnificus]NVD22814.1 hypothetical protein [Vibrio vulnificus]
MSSDTISMLALMVAGLSFLVSVYSIIKDNSRLKAIAKISYNHSANPNNPPPQMQIVLVNQGKRPITITHFGFSVSRKEHIWQSIVPPQPMVNDSGLAVSFPQGLAQDVGIKLNDGDVYEAVIEHHDYELLYSTAHDFKEAKSFFFMDVLGKRYKVKNSEKLVSKLRDFKA